MFHNFGKLNIFGIPQSRISCHGASLFMGFFWAMLLVGVDSQVTDPKEVGALLALKQNLIDPNGNLSDWSLGDPCASSWRGVLCFDRPVINGHLHVRELHLLNMNLSGRLPAELGQLAYLSILDVMWNNITGTIPKEIGNMENLEMLLLSGNKLNGPLPEEIGYLQKLERIQIDQNQISGTIPKSFSNLTNAKHFYMNNNSLSGQIPPELSKLTSLVYLLLDNNNLSGYLPPELSLLQNLLILQVDNNNFSGSSIPDTYRNMSQVLKLSFRNCSLQGQIPDISNMTNLFYIDFSINELSGSMPQDKISGNITTIDLSYNKLNGTIPANFSNLQHLQRLSLANNLFSGSVPSFIWPNITLSGSATLVVDLQNNSFSDISRPVLPPNVTIRLHGNPMCTNPNLTKFCGTQVQETSNILNKNSSFCPPQACPSPYEFVPASPVTCLCALPIYVGYRLKSPGFQDFSPWIHQFEVYLTSILQLELNQLDIDSAAWEEGPRLRMHLKIFPLYDNIYFIIFNRSEVLRIQTMFMSWQISDVGIFGPWELLNLTLLGPYIDVISSSSSDSGLSKAALGGIIAGAVAIAAIVCVCTLWLILRYRMRNRSKGHRNSKISIKIDGVKEFAYREMALATKNFDSFSQVGQGGYGKVYKGILGDGTIVAIKRAQVGSLQGEKEFLTEIELLSRLHHKNLVSLVGYCTEEGEQMLVYEFIPNGTLRDHLSGKTETPLSFAMRLRIAMSSAKGILYLHTEANPPIFHRDIKASNILLDSGFTAKVADFGLSRLAPIPNIDGVVPTYVSTVVKGTPGYLDPDYFLTHKLTDKSDVYSLGVVFLELLTGMPPIINGKNLVREVNIACSSGMMFEVIDKHMGPYQPECVEKFMTLALKCCEEETDARPSMAEVFRELEDIWLLMPESEAKPIESTSTGGYVVPSPSFAGTNPYISSDDSRVRDPGSEIISTLVPR